VRAKAHLAVPRQRPSSAVLLFVISCCVSVLFRLVLCHSATLALVSRRWLLVMRLGLSCPFNAFMQSSGCLGRHSNAACAAAAPTGRTSKYTSRRVGCCSGTRYPSWLFPGMGRPASALEGCAGCGLPRPSEKVLQASKSNWHAAYIMKQVYASPPRVICKRAWQMRPMQGSRKAAHPGSRAIS